MDAATIILLLLTGATAGAVLTAMAGKFVIGHQDEVIGTQQDLLGVHEGVEDATDDVLQSQADLIESWIGVVSDLSVQPDSEQHKADVLGAMHTAHSDLVDYFAGRTGLITGNGNEY